MLTDQLQFISIFCPGDAVADDGGFVNGTGGGQWKMSTEVEIIGPSSAHLRKTRMRIRREIEAPSQSPSVGWRSTEAAQRPQTCSSHVLWESITSAQGVAAGAWGGGAGLAS